MATPPDPATFADPLASLRDWHLPEPVSWWPPAVGWWLVAGLVLILFAVGLGRWRRYRRRTAPARAALAELRALAAGLDSPLDDGRFASAVSALLRRLALARYPRAQVAGLVGLQWLDFLDRTGGGGGFSRGPGQGLAELPYRQAKPSDGATAGGLTQGVGLVELAERWIRAHWTPPP